MQRAQAMAGKQRDLDGAQLLRATEMSARRVEPGRPTLQFPTLELGERLFERAAAVRVDMRFLE